jgi:glycosyltransferase involved in cell wall biosynthesis
MSALYKREFDAIFVNGYTSVTNWFGFLGAEIFDIPVIFRGASTLDNPPGPIGSAIKEVVLRPLFSRIDAFAAVGTRNEEYFLKYGATPDEITFAPNAVDNEYFQRAAAELPDQTTVREHVGLPDQPTVLFVGKLAKHKKPKLLIRAFSEVNKHNDATLVFVGDGEMRDQLEATTVRLGLDEAVVFTGFQNQSELPKYYKAADVLALPSSHETWGLVINEAMNFSLPIIASDSVGAVPDLVDDRNGRVVPTGDSAALAEAVETVLNSNKLRLEMGKMSRDRIDDWGIEETADGVVAAAEQAIINR